MMLDKEINESGLTEISLDVIAEVIKELELLSLSVTNKQIKTEDKRVSSGKRGIRPRLSVSHLSKSVYTTLMIRNLPLNIRQREALRIILLQFVRSETIDFFYLPTDISKASRRGLGFAFINFTTPDAAMEFRRNFGYRPFIYGGIPLVVTAAAVQGLNANIEHFRSNPCTRRVKNPEYLPLVRSDEGFVSVTSFDSSRFCLLLSCHPT